MNSIQRRQAILQALKEARGPLSAAALAGRLSVSRQVIVGDVALLRAAGEDITATPRGYVLGRAAGGRHTVVCRHAPGDMERELKLMVDYGCTVEDVVVEHSVYGQLAGRLDLSSRYDVAQFMERLRTAGGAPLSALTDGLHLHTLSFPDRETRDRVLAALKEAGFLLEM